jgi:hypothetical protein
MCMQLQIENIDNIIKSTGRNRNMPELKEE